MVVLNKVCNFFFAVGVVAYVILSLPHDRSLEICQANGHSFDVCWQEVNGK